MLLASLLIPAPHKITIHNECGEKYVCSIFAVDLHTSERDPFSDILPHLMRVISSPDAV